MVRAQFCYPGDISSYASSLKETPTTGDHTRNFLSTQLAKMAFAPGSTNPPRMRSQDFINIHTVVVPPGTLPTGQECPICLEDYAHAVEPAVRITRIRGCTHVFGLNCLRAMLDNQPNATKKCPLCRSVWIPGVDEAPRGLRNHEAMVNPPQNADYPGMARNGRRGLGRIGGERGQAYPRIGLDPMWLLHSSPYRAYTQHMRQTTAAPTTHMPVPTPNGPVVTNNPYNQPEEVVTAESFANYTRELERLRARAARTGPAYPRPSQRYGQAATTVPPPEVTPGITHSSNSNSRGTPGPPTEEGLFRQHTRNPVNVAPQPTFPPQRQQEETPYAGVPAARATGAPTVEQGRSVRELWRRLVPTAEPSIEVAMGGTGEQEGIQDGTSRRLGQAESAPDQRGRPVNMLQREANQNIQQIMQRERALEERELRLTERESRQAERESRLAERESRLMEREAILQQRERPFTEMHASSNRSLQ
ncbi:hypothetical protein K505DRAFT_31725 [Melanomma pulvis-pyrius CBS 109.77]|uniref:RING-type domain-containing protein n=1 Tax=Melanomma pulvis-pyrius CBS 109.77 TaxID=1314802 RepID=A0A6A6XC53_9PLEO|nr:hypothetical protein K505DRAFT_31725 [Melanomma pulvis-pyrius CBS 109.77]